MNLSGPVALTATSTDFPDGKGEMGALIRAFDWSRTPIGPLEAWSPALRTLIRVLLANRFPMLLWWGPEYISRYNDAYIPILGRKHPGALGLPVRECWSEIWDVLQPLIDTPFHGGPSTWIEDMELSLHRSGFAEETHFTVAYSPVPDETAPGGIGGVLATVHEITEKVVGARRSLILRDLGAGGTEARSAADACRTTAQILDRHRKDIPFALLYLLDSDSRQARLVASTGLDPESPLAPPVLSLDRPDSPWPFSQAHATKEMQIVLLDGTPHTAVASPLRSNSPQQLAGFFVAGTSPHLNLDSACLDFLHLATGQIASAINAAQAYEEERKRAEALAEIDRAKTAFFSNVSHEFRTPLTLMLGPLEGMLAAPQALPAETRDQLASAHRNSLRLLKLVNSLLDFSRIEAGRMKATYVPVDLAVVTTGLASNFRSVLESSGLGFHVECSPLPQPVYVDPEMWEKVVLNLLSNAFKFTFEGSVHVTLHAHDNHAVLTVTDTGTGIAASDLPHIFERFHRVEGARGRTYEGSGIGLALTQELVKLHGGSIHVASQIGEGATFTVTLPFGHGHLPQDRIDSLAPAEPSTARANAYTTEAASWLANHQLSVSSAGAHAAVRPRILVADDNADMREHICRILGSAYDITTVANGAEALAAARQQPPDLILSDVMMPSLDGFGLLRELRADSNLRDLPVILLSARAGEEARTEGIAAGVDEYLTKPFSASELLARVQTTLALHRTRRAAAAQFETLLNQAPLGVFLVDSQFRIRHINPTARPVFGNVPNLIGRDFHQVTRILWPHNYAEEVVSLFHRTMDTGQPYVALETLGPRHQPGAGEYFEWHVDRIPLPEGGHGVVCYFRDISAHVRIREEIARSEERFRAFVTASSDVVYRMNADWSVMLQLHGRNFIPETQDPSRSWLEKYIHPEDHAAVLAAIRDAIATKSLFEMEHRVIRVDGSIGWTFSRAVPLFDAQGEITEWFGTARDITERKRAQQAIAHLTELSEQQRRLYHTILSSTPDLVYVFDRSHRFTYANKALLTMWGKTWDEAIGRNCLELGYEPWHAEMHDREIEQVIATRQAIRGEVPFTGTQGRRTYDYIFVPVFGADGEVEAIAGTTRDITERKRVEEDLRRANEDLEQFAYTASHDLQEPLRSVKIYSELLTTRYAPKLDGQALQFLDYVGAGATRMELLVRDLLAYTRSTLLEKPSEPTSSAEALEATITSLAGVIAETGATIDFGPLPAVSVHTTHLQQLFQNLIGNAIKYRREGIAPVIHIAANPEPDPGRWRFSVSDNGIGIDPEYKERIFGLFKRLHTDEYSGTGIGLAICHRIVERYHGRIWVESEPGRGSTFYFTLPA